MWWVGCIVMGGCQCLLYYYLITHQYDIRNNTWHLPRYKTHYIFVGFIFVVHPYKTVPDPHVNLFLIKCTMLSKKILFLLYHWTCGQNNAADNVFLHRNMFQTQVGRNCISAWILWQLWNTPPNNHNPWAEHNIHDISE